MTHFFYFDMWHAFSVGGGVVTPTRPGIISMTGYSHCCLNQLHWRFVFVDNRRVPGRDEKYLIFGGGGKMTVEFVGRIDLVMHCDDDVKVALRDTAFVRGAPFDLFSLAVI